MSLPALSFLLLIVMTAFAANSVLGRIALEDGLIDAASYTAIRLGSGAVMLVLLVALRAGEFRLQIIASLRELRPMAMAFALFAYAAFFSFAYLELGAALGALVLFGAVQITMIGYGIFRGARLGVLEWFGVAVAIAGFVYLVAPGIAGTAGAPDIGATVLMIISGVAWGAYSIIGRGASDPLGETARNFVLATPLGLATVLLFASGISAQPAGIALAVASGALTSGLGYALWYRALPHITSTVAAVLQLTVPVIAAFGGIIFLGEALGWRFVVASIAILGGVAATVLGGRSSRNG